MSFRFLVCGTSVALFAGAAAALFPSVRSAPGWALIGWLLPVVATLLPGAWLIAHRGGNSGRWMVVWGIALLVRLLLLAVGVTAAVQQGPPARDAFLWAMALGFVAAVGYETVALLRVVTGRAKAEQVVDLSRDGA